jgi:hypothetical protein
MLRTSAVAMLMSLTALTASPASALEPYQGKKRPLVVFAPSDQHPGLTRQKSIVNGQRIGFSDRDVVVIYVVGTSVRTEFATGPGMSASALRSRYRASEGSFRVLLIGKDGGTRIDSPTALTAADLFSEIDRMPMRRDEVRKRGERIP